MTRKLPNQKALAVKERYRVNRRAVGDDRASPPIGPEM